MKQLGDHLTVSLAGMRENGPSPFLAVTSLTKSHSLPSLAPGALAQASAPGVLAPGAPYGNFGSRHWSPLTRHWQSSGGPMTPPRQQLGTGRLRLGSPDLPTWSLSSEQGHLGHHRPELSVVNSRSPGGRRAGGTTGRMSPMEGNLLPVVKSPTGTPSAQAANPKGGRGIGPTGLLDAASADAAIRYSEYTTQDAMSRCSQRLGQPANVHPAMLRDERKGAYAERARDKEEAFRAARALSGPTQLLINLPES